MGSIVRSAEGRLVIQFYFRRRLCREFLGLVDNRDNRRIADAKLRQIDAAIRRGEFVYRDFFPESPRAKWFDAPEPESLSVYYARWIGTLEIAPATKYDYEALGRAFLDRTPLGEMPVSKIDVLTLREVIKASGSVRRSTMFLQRLRAMLDTAIEDGIIERNVARRVKNPKRRERARAIPFFTPDEVQKILNAAAGQDRALIALMLGTGAGPGELLAVRYEDIDLPLRKLEIRGSVGRFGEGATKTAGRTRVINLVDTVAPVIPTLREFLKVPRIHAPIFANHFGAFLDFTNWRSRNWRRILAAASVAYRNPYACRHTYAIRMLQAGNDPTYVAQQMGHTSPQMVYRHYARWTNAPQAARGF